MQIDAGKYRECRELLMFSFENDLTAEQNERLNQLLEEDAVRHYYLDLVELSQNLKDIHWPDNDVVPLTDQEVWQLLAQYEKEAQPIVIPEQKPPIELITNVRQRKAQLRSAPRKIPASLWLSLGSVAAVLMVLFYMTHWAKGIAQPVAVLEDAMAAQWESPLQIGGPLFDKSRPYTLLKGFAKIRFNSGVTVHLESPAKFMFDSADQMRLEYGQLAARVPKAAKGFRVDTPTCQIIDLGTEFGVTISELGETKVQMFDGKASLASKIGEQQQSAFLTKGQARRVDMAGRMSVVSFAPNAFVREINSQTQIVWRGETELDLADMVGGGNGLGTGMAGAGIDPTTGNARHLFDEGILLTQSASQRFAATPKFEFIDCVFVPGLDDQPAQISTTGLTCEAFLRTDGSYWGYPLNGAWHVGQGVPRHTLVLDGKTLDENNWRAMTLHPNMGLTFDLQRIRQALPGPRPVRFCARVGLSETISDFIDTHPESEVWVLLDGQVKLCQQIRLSEGAVDIQVPFEAENRFLSLAVTAVNGGVGYNWVVFVNPVIELE